MSEFNNEFEKRLKIRTEINKIPLNASFRSENESSYL